MFSVLGGTDCFKLFLADLVFSNLFQVVPAREKLFFVFRCFG